MLLRNSGVGKTSILDSALRSIRLTSVHPTAVAQCSVLQVTFPSKMVKLAGQEVLRSIIPVSFHDPFAVLLADDISDHHSLASLEYWHSVLIEDGDAESALISVACNNIDFGEDLAESFAQGICGRFFKVSALNGNSIGELFGDSTQQIAGKWEALHNSDSVHRGKTPNVLVVLEL
jgi:GTPase SAR1 family protein